VSLNCEKRVLDYVPHRTRIENLYMSMGREILCYTVHILTFDISANKYNNTMYEKY